MLYKVQAGSFASKINALNRAALLDKAGYKTIVSMHVVEDSAPVDDKKTDKEPHRVRVWAINFMDEDESQYGDATAIIEYGADDKSIQHVILIDTAKASSTTLL